MSPVHEKPDLEAVGQNVDTEVHVGVPLERIGHTLLRRPFLVREGAEN